MSKFAVLALALVLVLTLVISGEKNGVEASGGYRKPPFNGSIFGKRAPEVSGGDPTASSSSSGGTSTGQIVSRPYSTYASFCEMAWETCFASYISDSSR